MVKKIEKAKLIIVKDQQMLVMRKRFSKNEFSVIGGVRKSKESIEETLVRETLEETKVQLSAKDYSYAFSVSVRKNKKHISRHYFLLLDTNKNFIINETDKFSELTWLPLIDLPKYFSPENTAIFNMYFNKTKLSNPTSI